MNQHLEFFARAMAERGDHKRSFLEIGRRAGRFPSAITHGAAGGPDREISIWCSNDYLGMGQNPSVLDAMKVAVDAFGAGSGGSRNVELVGGALDGLLLDVARCLFLAPGGRPAPAPRSLGTRAGQAR